MYNETDHAGRYAGQVRIRYGYNRIGVISNMQEDKRIDPGLQGNEKIEAAIAGLQQEPSQEALAHALTVIRRRMQEQGQLIVAVEPPGPDGQIHLQATQTPDGGIWWMAFTGFEEELKGGDSVKSTFLADIDQLFHSALQVDELKGVILNPWNCTLMLDKTLMKLVLG